jgi:hypothetical protein
MWHKGYGDLTPEQEAALLRMGLIKGPLTVKGLLNQLRRWTREHSIGVTAWGAFLLTTAILRFFATQNTVDLASLYQRSALLASWTFLFPFYLNWRHKGADVAGGISGGLAGYAVIAVLLALHDQSWWIMCLVWGIHYYSALRIAEAIRLESDANQEDIPLELDPPGTTPPSKPKQPDCLTRSTATFTGASSAIADVPTPAEHIFIRLAQQWHDGYATVKPEHAPPRHLDELALAAALLAREHGASFTNVAWQQVEANIALTGSRSVPWIDRLPWRLATAARLELPFDSAGIEELVCNLDHHNSSLRVWTMEVAWMVSPWLLTESAMPLLLQNVAGTLAGVEMAWGLAGALFDSEERFYVEAESWQPEGFAEQYAERVVVFKGMGLLATQAPFWKTEATCRRLIAETAASPDNFGQCPR